MIGTPIAATMDATPADPGAQAARPLWRGALRIVANHHVVALADQAVVSAASFVALVMIGRWGGASQLGAFAVGGSLLAMLVAAQESVVTRPYAIHMHRPNGTPAEHAASSLALSLVLAAVGSTALCTLAVVLSALGASEGLRSTLLALGAAAPFLLFREFGRRFAFAHLRIPNALAIDGAVAALNLAALAWLGWSGQLSAATAFLATGASCALSAAVWLYLARDQFAFRMADFRVVARQSWAFGKWLLSGQMALQAQGYMTTWLSMVTAGAAVTGIYAACMSIVAFSNPVLFGFYNLLTPRSVRALREEGGQGLRRQAALDSLLLAGIMTPFCAVIFLFGEQVMGLLFPAMRYDDLNLILTLLSLATMAAAVGVPASIGLASAEHPRAVAAVMALTAILTVVLVGALITRWGLLGAAYGVLAAELAGTIGRWATFLSLVPASGPPGPEEVDSAGAPAEPMASSARELSP